MKLSDAFIKDGGCLECEAKLLNINYGHNRELLDKCQRLKEYAIFVAAVRECFEYENHNLERAITKAIDECLEKKILEDILTKQRNEVFSMILSTFDKELYEKDLKEEAYEEGYGKGRYDTLCNLIKSKLEKGKSIDKIAEELEVTAEEVEKLMKQIIK